LRESVLTDGSRLGDVQRRGVRSLILSHKTGQLDLPTELLR